MMRATCIDCGGQVFKIDRYTNGKEEHTCIGCKRVYCNTIEPSADSIWAQMKRETENDNGREGISKSIPEDERKLFMAVVL